MEDSILIDHFKLENPKIADLTSGKPTTWIRGRKLGEGSFGTVWLETHGLDGKKRAVKRTRRQIPASGRKFNQELLAMTRLSRPRYSDYFAAFLGWYEEDMSISLVMEYFELGDLRKYLRPTVPLPEDECRDVIRQLLAGLDIMHDDSFAHRDLKPENIFVVRTAPQWRVKIGDLRISKRVWEDETLLQSRSGTAPYMAPKIFQWVEICSDDDY